MSNEITLDQDSRLPESEPQAQPKESLAPVSVAERISAMDILRGFALIGILLMNIEWFNRPISALMAFDFEQVGADYASSWLVLVFVQGKFYKLFSLLFGMGFAVMLLRAQEKEQPFAGWFARRMAVLFLLGMAHMVFFWGGDILHDYAIGGLLVLGYVLLLRIKRLQKFNHPKAFLKVGLTLLLVPLIFGLGFGTFHGATNDFKMMEENWKEKVAVNEAFEQKKLAYDPTTNREWPKKETPEEAQSAATVEGHDDDVANEPQLSESGESLATTTDTSENEASEANEQPDLDAMSFEERVEFKAQRRYDGFVRRDAKLQREDYVVQHGTYAEVTEFRKDFAISSLGNTPVFAIFILFPMFLIGYWFVASGKMRDVAKNKNFFRGLAWIGLPVGLLLNVTAVMIIQHPASQHADEIRGAAFNLFHYGQYALVLGYIGFVVLMTMRPRLSKLFSWMAPMGRMALTNYIMHSAILTYIFYGYGMGMYGEISRAPQMLMVVGIIAFQAIFSAIWLRFFKFGPLEWLWRSLTYMKFQSIR